MTLDEPTVQILRGLAPLAAFVLGLTLERLVPHAFLKPAWRVNLGLFAIGAILTTLVCGACGFAIANWAQASGFGLLNAIEWPLAAGIAVTILGLDLVSYAWHRANHVLPVLWRFHRVHHADADYHVSTALRFHPGELLLALPVRLVAIAALGAPPVAVLAFEAIFGMANVLEHGNFNLPLRVERIVGRVLVTPALHRRHHSTKRHDRDANYGTILSVWDRAARTLRPSSSAALIDTGLRDWVGAGERSLAAMLLAPLRSRTDRRSAR
jgi:sterol desaturase/sphingolipid hydroxylase (fatty acid hydroxylase superfamily)